MKKILLPLTYGWLTALLVTLCSCTVDIATYDTEDGLPVTISVGTGTRAVNDPGVSGVHYGDGIDSKIETIRVLGYRVSSRTLAFNKLVTINDALSNPDQGEIQGTIQIYTGDYDFVFIANEGSDPALANKLNTESQIGSMGQLKELSFSGNAFSQTAFIPMVRMIEQVKILGNDSFQLSGGPVTNGIWNVALERLAVRIELALKIPDSFASGAALSFENIPDRVYLLQKENIANRGARTVSAADQTTSADGTTTLKWNRIIVPESWFSDISEQTNAVRVCLTGSSAETKKAAIGFEPNTNYTLPRNYYFNITGTIEDSGAELDIALEVQPWEMYYPDGFGQEKLNVSAISATINERNMARIYFWSDQKDVKIGHQTAEGEDVDDIFYGLTGSDPDHFHYTFNSASGEGSGWFDILTDHDLPGFMSSEHKIYLCAGRVSREITVEVTAAGDPLSRYKQYVGAFWRNNQTGERVIAMPNTGEWSATVDHADSEAPGGWVVLAPGKSLDPDFWTDNPGNPESYQVEGNLTSITGTGDIYFRIGLTGPNTDFDPDYDGMKPRYAKVDISTTSGTKTLYLRQGEEADYVMRPTDPSTGSFVSSKRPYAVRYTPYNLTSSEYPDIKTCLGNYTTFSQIGSRATGNANATFTEYPTQAGAYFNWIDLGPTVRYSWFYPGSHIAQGSYLPVVDTDNLYWNTLEKENESCPTGYRRPTDGSITGLSAVETDVSESEQRQSLWLSPPVKFAGSNDNHQPGYYADGYFDRHRIVNAWGSLSPAAYSNVNPGEYRVAYIGRLFYNPHNNASLFFPNAGYSNPVNPNLDGAGTYGFYWSSSHSHVRTGVILEQFNAWAMGTYMGTNSHYNRAFRTSIRCVVGEDLEEEELWARSNIVMKPDGTLTFATTEEENAEIPAYVQGLLFKYGSLLGVNNWSDRTTFDKELIVFLPSEYTQAIPTSWAAVPFYKEYHLDAEDQFILSYPSKGFNAAEGIGDICRYISEKNWVQGNWRMPTQSDFQKLLDQGSRATELSSWGSPSGNVSVGNIGTSYGSGLIQAGYWLGRNHGTATSITSPGKGVIFFPAAGYFGANGSPTAVNEQTYYWSSINYATNSSSAAYWNDHALWLQSSTVRVSFVTRPNGMSVRCIRDSK